MRCFSLMLCALVTGVTLPTRVAAQEPISLTGLVSDEAGLPLGSAIVAIDALNLGTFSDEGGRYLLIMPASRVRAGQSVQVTASLIGRTSQTLTVTLQPGPMSLDFSLASDPLNLDEIVVKPGRYRETIRFLGKSIVVRSEQGPLRTVIFLEGETRTAPSSPVQTNSTPCGPASLQRHGQPGEL